jgi:hypothetical protein
VFWVLSFRLAFAQYTRLQENEGCYEYGLGDFTNGTACDEYAVEQGVSMVTLPALFGLYGCAWKVDISVPSIFFSTGGNSVDFGGLIGYEMMCVGTTTTTTTTTWDSSLWSVTSAGLSCSSAGLTDIADASTCGLVGEKLGLASSDVVSVPNMGIYGCAASEAHNLLVFSLDGELGWENAAYRSICIGTTSTSTYTTVTISSLTSTTLTSLTVPRSFTLIPPDRECPLYGFEDITDRLLCALAASSVFELSLGTDDVTVIDDDLGWYGCMWSLDHSQAVFGASSTRSDVAPDHRRLCVGEWGYENYHMLNAGVSCAEVDHLDTITELETCSSYALLDHGQASPDEHDLGVQGCWYFEGTQRVVFSPSGVVSNKTFTDYRNICLGVYQIYPEDYTVAAQGTTCADISLTTLSDRKICMLYASALGLNFSDSDQRGLYGCMYFEPVGQMVFSSATVGGQFSDYRSVCEGSTTTTTTGTSTSSAINADEAALAEPSAKTAGTWQLAVVVLGMLGGIGIVIVLIGCMVPRLTRGQGESPPIAV